MICIYYLYSRKLNVWLCSWILIGKYMIELRDVWLLIILFSPRHVQGILVYCLHFVLTLTTDI